MPNDNKENKKEQEDAESSKWKDVGKFALKTTVISGAILGGTALALPAIGFTAGGVAAGSLAASFQSAYLGGTIASGSAFALLQSAGAAGLAASTQAAIVSAGATLSAVHTIWSKKKGKPESDNTSGGPSESDEEGDVDEVVMEKNDDSDPTSPKSDSTRKDKKFPVKLVVSLNDKRSNSLKFNTQPPKYEDEMDSLRKKWEDVELSKDITITQHLVKK